MAKNLIKVLESADNAGKYEELKDHLDPKFLSTLGLTPEGYIDELKKFSGENHGTVEYESLGRFTITLAFCPSIISSPASAVAFILPKPTTDSTEM